MSGPAIQKGDWVNNNGIRIEVLATEGDTVRFVDRNDPAQRERRFIGKASFLKFHTKL